MAAELEGVNVVQNIKWNLGKILSEISPELIIEPMKIYWPRQLKCKYDLFVNLLPVVQTNTLSRERRNRLLESVVQALSNLIEESRSWKLKLSGCYLERNQLQLSLQLNRNALTLSLLPLIQSQNEDFGLIISKHTQMKKRFLVYVPFLDVESCSLTDLRSVILLEVISRFLEAHRVEVLGYHKIESNGTVLTEFLRTFKSSCKDDMLTRLNQSNYAVLHQNELDDSTRELSIDVAKYYCNHSLLINGIVHKTVPVGLEESNSRNCFTQAVNLEDIFRRNMLKPVDMCILIAPNAKLYHVQVMEIIWRISMQCYSPSPSFMTLSHGSVTVKDMQTHISADKFYRIKYDEMKQAFLHKYSDPVNKDAVDAGQLNGLFSALADLSVRFDILSCGCSSPVTFEKGRSSPGVFVMYNYARIHTLLSAFNEGVNQNVYDPLADVSNVDFSSLNRDEEWALIIICAKYPEIISRTTSELLENVTRCLNPSFQKVTSYLTELSHHLSIYYNRIHILTEPAVYQKNTLQAQIHLLKCIKQIMENSFRLLNVAPITQM